MSHFPSDSVVELIYSEKILPHFGIEPKLVRWTGHSEIGLDSTAHFFIADKEEFLLIYEDYPTFSEEEIAGIISPRYRLLPINPKGFDIYDNFLTYYHDDVSLDKVGLSGSFRLYEVVHESSN